MNNCGREPFAPPVGPIRMDYWTTGPQPGISSSEQVKNDIERLKTAYTELGQWARHYSAIRATLSIGLIAVASVLFNEAWQQNSRPIAAVSLGIIAIMFALLFMFTRFTFRMMARQNTVGNMLLLPQASRHRIPRSWWRDFGLLAGLVITIGYGVVLILVLCGTISSPPSTAAAHQSLEQPARN